MNSPRIAMQILIGLFFISILQTLYFYPKLPDTVAHHFGATGQADAWGSKTSFLLTDIGITSFLVALFVGLSKVIVKVPKDMINIPNRDYWLAPERKEQTLRITASFILWTGILSLLYLRILFQQICQINLSEGPQKLQHFWPGLVLYLAIITAMTWKFIRTFRIKRPHYIKMN